MRHLPSLLALCLLGSLDADENLPDGFQDVVIAQYLTSPTACVQVPDGRVFIAQQGGAILEVVHGVLQSQTFVTLNADSYSDRGVLGLCCDANFSSDHYLYVFYTLKASPDVNLVSRFDASGAIAGPETILFQGDPLTTTFCNGGGIGFGVDGKLYVCSGDNEVDANAQSMSTTLGKILRLNADGTIPSDNPFYSTTSGNEQAIYARGFRNNFSFAINPVNGQIFCNDVRGTNNLQVVDQVIAGADFGYPAALGSTVPAPYSAPLFSIPYGTAANQAKSLTGGVFYEPGTTAFPASYTGQYFFCDFSNGWLWTLDPANGNVVNTFGSGLPNPVCLSLGMDGSIYYIGRGDSCLHAISYSAPTTPPQSQTITGFGAFTGQTYGASPLTISGVTGGASGEPVVIISSNPSVASVSGTTVTILSVGSASITANQAGTSTYDPAAPVTQSLTVAPAALTISAVAASRAYGVANPTFTYTASTLVGSDAIGSVQETTTAGPSSPPGSYPITIANAVFSSGVSANYAITYANSSLQVGSGVLTVTAGTEQMLPGQPVPPLTYTISGFVNGDTQASATTGAPSLSTSVTSSSPVGSYPTTVAQGTLAATNYSFTLVNGAIQVGNVLTVTPDPQNISYGAALPAFTYSITGFLNGDTAANTLTGTPVITCAATSQSQVGAYDLMISQGTLAINASNSNGYVFAFSEGTLTIVPSALVISANDQSMTTGAPLPPLTASYAGFVDSEGPGNLTSPAVLTTSASSASPAGDYAILVSGAADPDYSISYQPGVLTVLSGATATGSTTTGSTTGTTTGSTTGLSTGSTTVTSTSSSGHGCGLGAGGFALIALGFVRLRRSLVPPATRLVKAISGRLGLGPGNGLR